MQKYLPSKKFLLILISIIVAVGIIYFFSLFKKTNTTNTGVDTETETKIQEFMVLDSDGDGLKDWEEALWKTDPKKPDTDGDNTSDGEEILLNRNPLIANINPGNQEPSDKIDEKVLVAEKKAVEDYIKLTSTETVARQLFSQYIATKKVGGHLTETDKFQIVENSIGNLPQITFNNYTEKDIIISNVTNNDSWRDYSNSLAEILIINLTTPIENIEVIINDFSSIQGDENVTEKTIQIFDRFTPLILKSQKTVASLLKVSVPQNLAQEHLNLVNSFQKIYENVDLMQKSAKDLIVLIPLLNHYENNFKDLNDSIINMVSKVISLNIDYSSEKDYGYQFFNVIIVKK
jgi:ABC-type cobalt transport system substrate-binding protein